MRANRRTDTKPELALRHALHRLGPTRPRLDLDKGPPGPADIAFTARKVAVFVDGCFWHACPEHGSKPRANEWYWGPKLVKNVERDRVNDAALILAGWTVVRLWEHVPLDDAVDAIESAALRRTRLSPAPPTQPEPRNETRPPPADDSAAEARRRLWQLQTLNMRVFCTVSTLPALAGASRRPGRIERVEPEPQTSTTLAQPRTSSPGTRSRPRCARRTRAATRKNSSTLRPMVSRASLRMLAENPTARPPRGAGRRDPELTR